MSLTNVVEQVTHFCRTGELDPALPHRLRVYLDHFRKKIKHNLKRAFPIAVSLFEPDQWDEIVHQFLAQTECSSPYFWTLPGVFVDFAKKNHLAEQLGIPYLEDLLDFEWLEIEVFMMADVPQTFHDHFDLDRALSLNAESKIVYYNYPVFEKNPIKFGHYFLLAFRHPTSKEVKFISLSPFYCRVLELLQECSGREALQSAAREFNLKEPQMLSKGEKFLTELFQQRAIK